MFLEKKVTKYLSSNFYCCFIISRVHFEPGRTKYNVQCKYTGQWTYTFHCPYHYSISIYTVSLSSICPYSCPLSVPITAPISPYHCPLLSLSLSSITVPIFPITAPYKSLSLSPKSHYHCPLSVPITDSYISLSLAPICPYHWLLSVPITVPSLSLSLAPICPISLSSICPYLFLSLPPICPYHYALTVHISDITASIFPYHCPLSVPITGPYLSHITACPYLFPSYHWPPSVPISPSLALGPLSVPYPCPRSDQGIYCSFL